jgi:hypothetical protein
MRTFQNTVTIARRAPCRPRRARTGGRHLPPDPYYPQPLWFPARLGHYWRAMCMRSSASVSSISLPVTSTVTLWMVPVNLNGLG